MQQLVVVLVAALFWSGKHRLVMVVGSFSSSSSWASRSGRDRARGIILHKEERLLKGLARFPERCATTCWLTRNDENQQDKSIKLKQISKKQSKTKSKKAKAKSKESDEPLYRVDPSDPVACWMDSNDDDADHSSEKYLSSPSPILLRFTVRGNPLPLRRHRTSRGFVYNPSAKAQESFRTVVQELIGSYNIHKNQNHNSTTNSTDLPLSFFGGDQALAMTLIFYTKRPQKDFFQNRRSIHSSRLRPDAPTALHPPSRTDVDNLAKFVLDALTGVLYDNDKQVASMHVTKLRQDDSSSDDDNDDNNDTDGGGNKNKKNEGCTVVCVRVLREQNVPALLERSLNLF